MTPNTNVRIVAITTTVLLIPVIAVSGFLIAVRLVDTQRWREARPAFDPLLPLGVSILRQPIPLNRHIAYVLTFDSNSELSDANVKELLALNQLPEKNSLGVIIETPHISDEAVPALVKVQAIDDLGLVGTSMTPAGVERLRKLRPSMSIYYEK
ncbi:hypothetical protein [Stratiformator vulcanicus]|uniref:Uncharacterized protein n=1 Tax=Stratiformator vulcanicus TaxID=2527980 RepID=A0A517R554_9PLAN|nr:hypothetical protein [Stratiformator vulcanicus]QDT39021.1 hypothetical protein Pan189_34220 [Stratiformator vulcanicus]